MSHALTYDLFIRKALAAGFTDDQADFMWEYLGVFFENIIIPTLPPLSEGALEGTPEHQ